jgi:hypothetical protein
MIQRLKTLTARYEIATSGYFDVIGWFHTRSTGRAVDAASQPIPWLTYPAIAFLSERVHRDWRVLEFGAGMGTQWWAKRVGFHVALEHDPVWAERIAKTSSAKVLQTSDLSAKRYLAPAIGYGLFDVVIVDGLFRNECLNAACELVSERGVILLDDAQRADYKPAIDSVLARGFRCLPFHGPQPVSKHAGCTATFYRSENVLGI